MFDISPNKIITVTRGDSFEFPVTINCGTEYDPVRYNLTDADTFYFAVVEPKHPFEDAIVRKVYTKDDMDEDGDVVVSFEPKDTQFLHPGVYYYEAKLKTDLGEGKFDVATVTSRTKFIIVE